MGMKNNLIKNTCCWILLFLVSMLYWFLQKQQGLIEISPLKGKRLVKGRRSSRDSSRRHAGCERQVLLDASFLRTIAGKCVDKSWMSCWSCVASGVGWHSVWGAACQTDAGPLECRLCLSPRFLSKAPSLHLNILRLVCSVGIVLTTCFTGIQCKDFCFCLFYTDISRVVFSPSNSISFSHL